MRNLWHAFTDYWVENYDYWAEYIIALGVSILIVIALWSIVL